MMRTTLTVNMLMCMCMCGSLRRGGRGMHAYMIA